MFNLFELTCHSYDIELAALLTNNIIDSDFGDFLANMKQLRQLVYEICAPRRDTTLSQLSCYSAWKCGPLGILKSITICCTCDIIKTY